jgi:uncharacterized protein YjiS (DUF1127 family)
MLLSALIRRGWDKIRMWRQIAHERSELRRLSEYIAKDIGISRADAEREADRPFWDSERGTNSSTPRAERAGTNRHKHCLHAR